MAVSAATGFIALAEQYLAATLAKSATWRTWIGASGSDSQQNTQALARIHFDLLTAPDDAVEHTPEELQQRRPFALIGTLPEEGFGLSLVSIGVGHQFTDSGRLVLLIEDDVAEIHADNLPEALRQFKNKLGGVIGDMAALAGTAGYLAITEVRGLSGPALSDPKDETAQGASIGVEMIVSWGTQG